MIVKPKTYRYSAGLFKRLVNYIYSDKGRSKDDLAWSYFHNLSVFTPEEIVAAFKENDTFRRKRKNGIAMHQLIMSFAPEDTPHLTPEIIQDLVHKFLELLGEKGVVFGRLHEHDNHMHVHLLVSGNEYGSSKSTSKRKHAFLKAQVDLERCMIEKYPQLIHSIVHLKELQKQILGQKRTIERDNSALGLPQVEGLDIPLSETEKKIKERLGNTPTKKEELKQQILNFLNESKNTEQFYDLLENNDFEIYLYRDKIRGIRSVKDNNKRFRFPTIGIPEKMVLELDLERNYRLDLLNQSRSNPSKMTTNR